LGKQGFFTERALARCNVFQNQRALGRNSVFAWAFEQELGSAFVVAAMNAWNRMAISFRQGPVARLQKDTPE
jgi:hypothetical protein